MEKEKEYNGFWKQAGCLLSVVAILAFITILVLFFYFAINRV
ncbi:hypothetical protein [Flagellimonas lutaonensis]|jgi:hypothetical protein|nr:MULTISPECIES: hypothetical protein [Allomuricauda]|tara:strand:+ start:12540 stop:12665 length:126 start_codon:yes stop_codon:yes gene_type:complete